jgi:hypothetical protein
MSVKRKPLKNLGRERSGPFDLFSRRGGAKEVRAFTGLVHYMCMF